MALQPLIEVPAPHEQFFPTPVGRERVHRRVNPGTKGAVADGGVLSEPVEIQPLLLGLTSRVVSLVVHATCRPLLLALGWAGIDLPNCFERPSLQGPPLAPPKMAEGQNHARRAGLRPATLGAQAAGTSDRARSLQSDAGYKPGKNTGPCHHNACILPAGLR
jgi:hypothetical protein